MPGGKALNVKMNFQIDTTQAQQQLKGLYNQLNQITSASAFGRNSQLGITSQIMEATKAAAQLKTTLSEAVNPLTGNLDLGRFNDQLRLSGMSLGQYRESLSALGTTGNAAFNQLARSISTAEVPMLRMGKAAQTMWTVLGNTVRWQATSSLLHGIMSTASNAMNYVKSLDSSLNHIRIVTGQNEEQMARFAKTANQAAKELNTSTNEYAKASLIYYQQGLSNKQVEERTRTTIKLANVAGQSAKTVSDQMTAVWNNFYDGSKSLEYYADVITALGASTASSSEEIAKGLQKFSSIAQTTGLSYEYATSALSTVVAATRQSADSVGTSFKTLFSRLQGLSLGETLDDGTTLNKYSQALNVVGVNIKKANGDLKTMDTILSEIGERWQSLSQDSKVALAQTVGGVRNYTGLMSLMDHWDEFQVNLKTAQNAQGTLQAQADIYAESWQAASAHVKAASETIYKNLLDDKFFKGLTNGFGSILDVIGEMTNQLGGFRGSLFTIGNLATQFFRPQLTQGLANLGSSFYGMTSKGYQELINLRTEARDAVTKDLRFSQYDSVNQLTHNYNKAFNARQVEYDMAVEKGKISQIQQPVYQMLFNNMAQQEQQVIQKAEQSAVNQLGYTRQYNQAMAGVNNAITARQKYLQQNLGISDTDLKLLRAREAAIQNNIPLDKTTSDQVRELMIRNPNILSNYEQIKSALSFKATDLLPLMDNYEKAVTREEAVRNISGVLLKHEGANLSEITDTGDLRIVAQDLRRLAIGAKESNESLDSVIPGLGKFNEQINTMGKDISEMSDQELQKLFKGKFSDLVSAYINREAATTKVSETIRANIENKVRTTLGYGEGEGKDVIDKVTEALTAKGLKAEDRVERLKTLGLTKEQQDALLGDIQNQKNPQTIAMSGAITTITGAVSALSNTIVSSVNAVKTFSDANSTATQKIAAMGSTAMSFSMLAPQLKNFSEHMGDVVSIFGKSTKMTVGQMGLWGAIAAVTIGGGIAAYQDIRKTSYAGALENYNTALATSTQLASDAKTNYEQLLTSTTQHNNLLDNLNSLRQGTEEFTMALLDANTAATNIIEDYDLIYGQDYSYNAQGAIQFNNGVLDQTIKQAQQEMIDRSIGKQQITYARQILDTSITDKDKKLKEKSGYLDAFIDSGLINLSNEYGQLDTINLLNFIQEFSNEIERSGAGNFVINRETKEEELKLYENDFAQRYLEKGELGGHITGLEGYKFTAKTIQDILNVSDIASAGAALYELAELYQNGKVDQINEFLGGEGYKSQRQLQNEAAIQGLVNVSISGVQGGIKNGDLISTIIANDLIQSGQAGELMKIVNRESINTLFNEGDKTPDEWYQTLFGKERPEGMEDSEVTTQVMEGLLNELILNGSSSEKLKGAEGLLGTLSSAGFKGVFEIADTLSSINLPNIENLALQDLKPAFEEAKKNQDKDTQEAIDTYSSYANQLFVNQITELEKAILVSYSDSIFDKGIEQQSEEYQNEFSKKINALAGTGIDQYTTTLTYASIKEAITAMTNANQIGTETGQAMYDLLVEGRKATGGKTFDADTLAVIRNFNYDNSIAGLYANNRLTKYAQNENQRNKYMELFSKQLEDIDKEKGFFQMLYNSSGFSDVLDTISSQFESTGQITAQYITDLADKSETLKQALQVSSENFDQLHINAAGLASIFEEINKGTISSNLVSGELLSALSIAGSREAANASAFDVIDNLNLGRSGLEFLDYFHDMGKVAYQAQNAGWGFYSEPIQNVINKIGGKDVKQAYAEANQHSDWTFQQMWDYLPTYFTDFLDTMAGKKGKGGGGPADVMTMLYKTLGENGIELNDELWNTLGFRVDEKGGFYLRENTDFTQDELVNNLTKQLVSQAGFDEESARNYAQVILGTASTSGQIGRRLDERGAERGYNKLVTSELPQSEKDLRAWFNQYGTFLKDENGAYYGVDDFNRFYQNYAGNRGFSAENNSTWAGITSTADLVTAAQKAGTTYKGEKVSNFEELAAVYGAFENGNFDYNQLVKMIESMNGTEADLIKILDDSPDKFRNALYGTDKYGNVIKFSSEFKSLSEFFDRLNTPTAQQNVLNRAQTQGAMDVAAGISALWWVDPTTGEAIFDPVGQHEQQYKNNVSSAKGKKSAGVESGEFEDITEEEQNAFITDTATRLKEYKAAEMDLTKGQEDFLRLYGDGNNRDELTNKLLTQILYNTDTVVDQTGEIVDLSQVEDEQRRERLKAKGGIDGEEVLDENGEPVLPSQAPQVQQSSSGGSRGGTKPAGGITKDGDSLIGVDSSGNPITWDGTQWVPWKPEESSSSSSNTTHKPGSGSQAGRASGQNNALLTFATGTGGHIAVTGELGPELRIKQDGSADLLGKKGREYAWVEPSDRIYTATQTAGILGNNNIPALEGLARGIKNYIPGYAIKSTLQPYYDPLSKDYVIPAGGHPRSRPTATAKAEETGGDWPKSGGYYGGGGAAPKKDPRYDPNTLKIRDILERYYTILQQIDDIARELEHIGKVVDRSWGQERISGLKTQQKLLEKQYQAQQKYVEEIKSYLGSDKSALTTMMKEFVADYNKANPNAKLSFNGATFDENGVLTNYKEFVENLVAQYNKNADANAQNKEAQYKFQEQLKDIQKYTETLNLYEAELEKLYDLQVQKLDAMIQIISTKIANEEELDNNDLLLINYELDKVKKNAYDAADAIALISEKSAYSQKSIERQMNGILDVLGNYMDEGTIDKMKDLLVTDPAAFFDEWLKLRESADFKDLQAPETELIEQYMQGMVSALQEWRDNFEQVIDYMGDSIKEFAKDLDEELGEFDFFGGVMESYQNILNLTSRTTTGIDDAFMQGLSEQSLNNSINKLKGARREQEAMAKALAQANSVVETALATQAAYTGDDAEHIKELQREVEKAQENAQKVNEQYEKSVNEFMKDWESALDAISKNYEQAVQNATKAFEASFSPFYKTLDLLEAEFSRQRELGDLYVDDYQRIHDLSKLNRDIEQSIIDTDSLKGKAKLRELQEEIIKLQEDGTELSEYDLDILDKKYKLELARQALEDSKNAKSMVRLSRDNNGNWGYVYTSNQDDVAEAEQNYEDAIRDMEEANQNYMDSLEEQLVAVQRDAMQQISALRLEDFDSEEAMLAEAERIWNAAMEKAGYLTSQLQNVFGNNGYLGPFIEAMYGANEHNLATDFTDLPIFQLLGLDGSEGYLGTMNERIGTLVSSMNKAVSDMVESQKTVWEEAGYDATTAATDVSEAFDNLSEQSDQQVEKVEAASVRVETAFGKITEAIKKQIVDMAALTEQYERFLYAINEILHLSNAYDPNNPDALNTLKQDPTLTARFKEIFGEDWDPFSGDIPSQQIEKYATGGYTGEWGSEGRLAFLHQKELVLNADDTKNLLNTMSIVKQLDNFAELISSGIGNLIMPKLSMANSEQLEQNVHIEASFPNVVDHNEIEQAFGNLVNLASQYANRKHI